jgi:small subunit ribosomal protein S8e
MSVWHGDSHKRKPSGGRKRGCRKKRKFEQGLFPAETILGETKRKVKRQKGGNLKVKVLRDRYACATDPKSGKIEKVEVKRVIRNPANVDYDRRGVITKGAIIQTPKGLARVTSRPGQTGVINAILISEEKIG